MSVFPDVLLCGGPEYPFFLLCAYSYAGIPNRDAEILRPVFCFKTHIPMECELQDIGQQVIYYLSDMRAITANGGVQTGEGRGKCEVLLRGVQVVGHRYHQFLIPSVRLFKFLSYRKPRFRSRYTMVYSMIVSREANRTRPAII